MLSLPFSNVPASITVAMRYEQHRGWLVVVSSRKAWERWDDTDPTTLDRLSDEEVADVVWAMLSDLLAGR